MFFFVALKENNEQTKLTIAYKKPAKRANSTLCRLLCFLFVLY